MAANITTLPYGAHRHPLVLRCSDCSWRAQSNLLLKESQQNVQGNFRFSAALPFAAFGRVRFDTRPRRATELAEVAEPEDRLEPLVKLTVEPGRTSIRRLFRLPVLVDAGARSGLFLNASAIATKEAASVSGGEFRHRCIGSIALSTKVPEPDICTGLDPETIGRAELRRYRLLRRGRQFGCI